MAAVSAIVQVTGSVVLLALAVSATRDVQRWLIVMLATWLLIGGLGRLVAARRPPVPASKTPPGVDALTGLADRAAFLDVLSRDVRQGRRAVVIAFDLDGFKRVNEVAGHRVGDQLLAAVADNLAAEVRVGDRVARFGGDEFSAVLYDVDDPERAAWWVRRLQAAIARPLEVGGRQFQLSTAAASVPIEPRHAYGMEVQRDLDLAMAVAKERGRGTVAPFQPWMLDRMRRRVELIHAVRPAITRRRIDVVFQPLIRADCGRVAGFEALVRWHHPAYGAIPPDEIVAYAEASGMADALAGHVVATACRHVAAWREDDGSRFVTVNLSAQQVTDAEAMMATIDAELAANGLPSEALVLEVTESTALDETSAIGDLLVLARRRGVRVAIDDFGRDHSSLSRLRTLEVDIVKLDRDLVVDLTSEQRNPQALQSVVQLIGAFGYEVVAEGIESVHQHDAVVGSGCGLLQGYLYSAPRDAADIDRWLEHRAHGTWRRVEARASVPTFRAVPSSSPDVVSSQA